MMSSFEQNSCSLKPWYKKATCMPLKRPLIFLLVLYLSKTHVLRRLSFKYCSKLWETSCKATPSPNTGCKANCYDCAHDQLSVLSAQHFTTLNTWHDHQTLIIWQVINPRCVRQHKEASRITAPLRLGVCLTEISSDTPPGCAEGTKTGWCHVSRNMCS